MLSTSEAPKAPRVRVVADWVRLAHGLFYCFVKLDYKIAYFLPFLMNCFGGGPVPTHEFEL